MQGLARSCRQGVIQQHSRALSCRASQLSTTPPAAAVAASAAGSMSFKPGYIPQFMQRVAEVNNGVEQLRGGQLVPWVIEGHTLGYLKPEFADRLSATAPEVFHRAPTSTTTTNATTSNSDGPTAMCLNPALTSLQQRTDAVAGVLQQLREQGLIRGWREELYPVSPTWGAPPLLLMERAAAAWFGIRAYGVHLNGYVVAPDGSKSLWVAKRSAAKPTWPGKLDHLVAGGQPHGLSCAENVVKECWEEAGIPQQLAAGAVPVGFVSYVSWSEEGLKPDVLFCYDLQLPANFVPVPQDGEVESFQLMSLQQVADIIATSAEYKPNCALVIMDFFLRHGALCPDEPGYLGLVQALRQGQPC